MPATGIPAGGLPVNKMGERARLAWLLLGHAALAARLRLRCLFRSPPPPWDGKRPLRVLFLSAHPASHLGTVSRISRWKPHLERLGCEVTILCPSTEEEFDRFGEGDLDYDFRYCWTALRTRARDFDEVPRHDVVVLHRAVFPFGPWLRPTFERILSRLNPCLVYDFYDSIWVLRQATHAASRSAVGRWLNPPDTVEQICRMARAVTVSSEYLATVPRSVGADVRVLPMTLEPGEYQVKIHSSREPVVLGWMGNRGNLGLLQTLAPALRRVARDRRILLRVVAPLPIKMEGVPVECLTHPWSRESEVKDLISFDIGLLPILDDEQGRGKSPLKLLQYAVAELPVVASPVAIDPKVFVEEESILFASTEDEWVEKLVRLVDDAALRARLGRGARDTLERSYSFAVHAGSYVGLLRSVAAAR
jgi:glycosyltransferase involved in cell wall biosynthesis